MIYTLAWLPSVTFLGAALMFLIVTVFAVAAVLAAIALAVLVLVALAIATARALAAAMCSARRHWSQVHRASEPTLETKPQPVAQPMALSHPNFQQVR